MLCASVLVGGLRRPGRARRLKVSTRRNVGQLVVAQLTRRTLPLDVSFHRRFVVRRTELVSQLGRGRHDIGQRLCPVRLAERVESLPNGLVRLTRAMKASAFSRDISISYSVEFIQTPAT